MDNLFGNPQLIVERLKQRKCAPELPKVEPVWDYLMPKLEEIYASSWDGHDLPHILRVYNTALNISKILQQGDARVLALAVFFHDARRQFELDQKKLGLPKEQIESHFGPQALKFIRDQLQELSVDHDVIEKVLTIIKYHEVYDRSKDPDIIELLILQDADRLDAVGWIGIARAMMYGGAYGDALVVPGEALETQEFIESPSKKGGSVIHHFYEKLFKLASTMHTEQAIELAKTRIHKMMVFTELLFEEMAGSP